MVRLREIAQLQRMNELRAPEEVCKAHLCGIDLRGVKVEGVDFNLVDLRGVQFDRSQVAWLRRRRAILDRQFAV